MKRVITNAVATIALAITTFAGSNVELLGAGATFPFPLYSKMFTEYHKETGTKVNYQAIGSGGGVKQITAKTVDFGASDKYLNDKKLSKIPAEVVHIPTCLGAVVVTYNLPGKPELKLDGDVISDIFMGKIKKWNDKKIKALNPKVKLPRRKITVVHRSDGSGTTYIFSDFLSKVSAKWKQNIGAGKSLKWPTGMGAKGNDGVAGMVKKIPGSIGYCELAYSLQNRMPQATIKNMKGYFVKPTVSSISAVANGNIPADTRVTLTNTDAQNGYPIASFTWLILYAEQNYNRRNKEKVSEAVKLIEWMLTKGQRYAEPLHYAPLSDGAKQKALAQLKRVQFNGKSLN